MYLRFAAAVLLLAVFLFPIYRLFMIAFKTPEEIFSSPPAWYPATIQFDNFRVLFKDGDAKTVFNSLFIAGAAPSSPCSSAPSPPTAWRVSAPAGRTWRCGSSRVANLMGEERRVRLDGLGGASIRVAILDEGSFVAGAGDPDALDGVERSASSYRLELRPCAVARCRIG